jgi:organic hydroperoxide reductase OsmC/OhrA
MEFFTEGGNMSAYTLSLEWTRNTADFNYDTYSRTHTVRFGDGGSVCGSSAPEFHGDPRCLDPEQAFVMSMASCHLLTFLAIASKKEYVIDKYSDRAVGELGKNKDGKSAIIRVELRPEVVFSGVMVPTEEEHRGLHERAHRGCIIANTVAGNVTLVVTPKLVIADRE